MEVTARGWTTMGGPLWVGREGWTTAGGPGEGRARHDRLTWRAVGDVFVDQAALTAIEVSERYDGQHVDRVQRMHCR